MDRPHNVPKLLIKLMHQQNQLFPLVTGTVRIGRSEECELILPNSGVSRVHAIITQEGDQFVIRDNQSQNGFRINGEASTEHVLHSGDEIHLGVFSLVFLSDRLEDNYYRGRSVTYLPIYNPKIIESNDDSTFAMSNRDKNLLARKSSLLYHGCITTKDGRFFYPEENPLTFGKNAVISINHWWVFGVVAEIVWADKAHVLQKTSWFCPVKVNDTNIDRQLLKAGDKVQIGNDHFTYTIRQEW